MKAALLYMARRLGWALVLVAGVTTLSFVVAQLLPGDPARMLVGPQASAEDAAHVRALYGLDRPVAVQYARYWSRLVHRGAAVVDPKRDPDHASCQPVGLGLHVDLGYSFLYRKPVVALLLAKAPRSFDLALAALGVQLVVGVGLGIAAAARRGTAWDEATIGAALVGASAPTFLLGLLFQYLLAYKLRLLPYDGYGATAAEHARSIVLPALTLGVFGSALYARLTREELGDLLGRDFVRTARAKGASGARVLVVHALRNALLPIATLAALDLGTMIGGAVVTEKLFRWPGVGQMAVEALVNRDGPVIFGTVLFASTAVVLSMLSLDILLVLLDPRLRGRSGPPG
jgi:peptide/nickel transport system permease protein